MRFVSMARVGSGRIQVRFPYITDGEAERL